MSGQFAKMYTSPFRSYVSQLEREETNYYGLQLQKIENNFLYTSRAPIVQQYEPPNLQRLLENGDYSHVLTRDKYSDYLNVSGILQRPIDFIGIRDSFRNHDSNEFQTKMDSTVVTYNTYKTMYASIIKDSEQDEYLKVEDKSFYTYAIAEKYVFDIRAKNEQKDWVNWVNGQEYAGEGKFQESHTRMDDMKKSSYGDFFDKFECRPLIMCTKIPKNLGVVFEQGILQHFIHVLPLLNMNLRPPSIYFIDEIRFINVLIGLLYNSFKADRISYYALHHIYSLY